MGLNVPHQPHLGLPALPMGHPALPLGPRAPCHPGFQPLPRLFCRRACSQACLLARPQSCTVALVAWMHGWMDGWMDITSCLQTSSPSWTLGPCCDFVCSPVLGPVFSHPCWGSLDRPWTLFISCLVWCC